MKKILGALMLLALSVTLFGCGGDNTETTEDSDQSSFIVVWIHKSQSDDEGKIYNALVNDFNNAGYKTADGTKDLKIRLEYKGSAETLASSISSEILTGGLPDLIAIDSISFAAYASEKVIVPITDYVTQETMDTYLPSVIEQSTIGGELYGLSGQEGPGGLYYNKEIINSEVLAAVGLSDYGTVDDPWSWKDVYNVLKYLRQTDTSTGYTKSKIKLNLGFGGDEGCMWLYSSLVYSAGGTFNSGEVLDGYLNSAQSVAGLSMLELFQEKVNGDSLSYTGANEDAFAQGLVPLQVFGAWDVMTISREYSDFEGKYGIMPMPVYEDESGNKGTIATPCGSWGFAVTKDSTKIEDAVTVIEYLTGEYAGLMMFEGIGALPTNLNLLNTNSAFTEDGPYKELRSLLDYAVPRPAMVKYPQLTVAYGDIIEYIETMTNDSNYDLEAYVSQKIDSIM